MECFFVPNKEKKMKIHLDLFFFVGSVNEIEKERKSSNCSMWSNNLKCPLLLNFYLCGIKSTYHQSA